MVGEEVRGAEVVAWEEEEVEVEGFNWRAMDTAIHSSPAQEFYKRASWLLMLGGHCDVTCAPK